MKGPVKPCPGLFSDELQALLERNRERDQWATYACGLCGVTVGATRDRGKWVPEQHWPSVKYRPPTDNAKKQRNATDNVSPEGESSLAEEPSLDRTLPTEK
jgi:hypothetical protein